MSEVERLQEENLILKAELQRVRQVASDRLVFIRILESCVNGIDSALRIMRNDLVEVSTSVAQRNNPPAPIEDAGEEE